MPPSTPSPPNDPPPPSPFVNWQHTSPLAQLAALVHDVTVGVPVSESMLDAASGLEPPLGPALDPDELALDPELDPELGPELDPELDPAFETELDPDELPD